VKPNPCNVKVFFLRFLLLIVFFQPNLIFPQTNISERRIEFYKELDSLFRNPESIYLQQKNQRYNEDSLLNYYNEIKKFYQEYNLEFNDVQQIAALYELGLLNINLGHNDSAIITYQSALAVVDRNKHPQAYIRLNFLMGDAYRQGGMKQKSNDILEGLLNIYENQMDSSDLSYCRDIITENYETLGDYQKALEMSLEIYRYYLERKAWDHASYKLIEIGRISSYLEEDTSYMEYFHEANRLALKSGKTGRIENNLVNTAIAYRKENFPKISLEYLNKTKEYTQFYSSYGTSYTLLAFAKTYFALDSIPQALYYTRRAKNVAVHANAHNYILTANMILIDYYIRLDMLDSAQVLLKEAVELSKKIRNRIREVKLYRKMSELSFRTKDYEKATIYLDSSYNIYRQFVSKTNDDKLVEMRAESDYFIHKAKITELVSKNRLALEKSKRLLLIILSVILVLAISIFLLLIIRKRLLQLRESYVNLVKKNIELDMLNSKLNDCEIQAKKFMPPNGTKDEEMIIKKLRVLLFKEEIFTEVNISLKLLADRLETNTSYLSSAINNHFNNNFRTVINQYRIDKARKMLVSEEYANYSVEGIASEVGFKSTSSFYQAFKTVTGLSPGLYVSNYRIAILMEE